MGRQTTGWFSPLGTQDSSPLRPTQANDSARKLQANSLPASRCIHARGPYDAHKQTPPQIAYQLHAPVKQLQASALSECTVGQYLVDQALGLGHVVVNDRSH